MSFGLKGGIKIKNDKVYIVNYIEVNKNGKRVSYPVNFFKTKKLAERYLREHTISTSLDYLEVAEEKLIDEDFYEEFLSRKKSYIKDCVIKKMNFKRI